MAGRPHHTRRLLAAACLLAWGGVAIAQDATVLGSPELLAVQGASSSAYPDGTFAEQLAAASQGEGGPIGSSRHRPGPGRRDDWKVGPHWRATVDGVLLFRDAADMAAILAEVGPIAPSTVLPPLEFLDNFDHAAGVRLLVTSEFPQCAGYELQVGYLGVEKWMANAYWQQETIPAASLPLSDIDVEQRRTLGYESSLHALELNFQRVSSGYVKPFAGVRYLALDESVTDTNRQFTTVILGDPDVTVLGDSLSSATAQLRRAAEIENNLIGFQGGLRLDMWRPTRRLHVNGFLSAGVFCNIVDRNRIAEDTTTITTKEVVDNGGTNEIQTTTNSLNVTSVTSADGTRIAYTTEASIAATWRLNASTALRGGYQALYVGGVELAENFWTAPPPVTPDSDDLFLHGWFAGIEYRR